LQFVPIADIPGRAANTVLTTWRHELEELPLLRRMAAAPSTAVAAVIDANVFLDLDDESEGGDESAGLLADWLTEFVELHITDELFTEINRRDDCNEREYQRQRAGRFPRARRDADRERELQPHVASLIAGGDSPSAASDVGQIAKTIAAGVSLFVSRDSDILSVADELYERFGLRVVQPHELVLHFDELRREEEYRPRRLAFGATTRAGSPKADDLEALLDLAHHGQPSPEPRRQTRARVREFLAAPDAYPGTCVTHAGKPLVAYFVSRPAPHEFAVPFFAASADPMGTTAARHYVDHLVHIAAREGRQLIRFAGADGRVNDALSAAGFSWEGSEWIKLALTQVGDAAAVEEHLRGLAAAYPVAADLATRVATSLQQPAATPTLAKAERTLWPGKIRGAGLRCFIVPIRPHWAKELFDQDLAQATLFGGQPRLVMNSENVYYRAARPALPTPSSRVLWYVSADKRFPHSQAIRACSYVDEVVVAPPKEVFKRFRRLGIYEWKHVFGIAGNDLAKDVMAFRFSMTETFRHPVAWTEVQRVLEGHRDRGSQIQGPLEVSEACFLELYELGTQGDQSAA
jgi:hypothetical protein